MVKNVHSAEYFLLLIFQYIISLKKHINFFHYQVHPKTMMQKLRNIIQNILINKEVIWYFDSKTGFVE